MRYTVGHRDMQTGDPVLDLVAAVVRRAIEDTLRGSASAKVFLDDFFPEWRTSIRREEPTMIAVKPASMKTFFLNERIGKLFAQVLDAIPEDVSARLRQQIALATDSQKTAEVHGAYVGAIASVAKAAHGHVLYIDSDRLRDRRSDEIGAIIAHELAHIVRGHTFVPAASMKAADERRFEHEAENTAAL